MRKIREILRLKCEAKLTTRQIAQSCNRARSTIANYLERAEKAGLRWPLPNELDEDKLPSPTSGQSIRHRRSRSACEARYPVKRFVSRPGTRPSSLVRMTSTAAGPRFTAVR